MASYTISPIWGAGAQLFDNSGKPLTSGKIYTYLAGTTTPATTYTNPIGTASNTNPIIANAAGRLANEIWFPVSGSYKFVLKDANDALLATYDNIPTSPQPPVVNDASSVAYEQGYEVTAGAFTVGATYLITSVGSTDFVAIGAASNTIGVHFTSTGVGSGTGKAQYSRFVQARLRDAVSVKDFGAVGNGIADDTVAIQAALNYINSISGGTVYVPNGTYNISAILSVYSNTTLTGQGRSSVIYSTNTTRLGGIQALGTSGSPFTNVHITNLTVKSSTTYSAGVPSTSTGAAVTLTCCDYSSVEDCYALNWSDSGIFGNGCNYSLLANNTVDQTAQGIGFVAGAKDGYNNIVSNNTVTNTGTYNAVHLEGAFGGSPYKLYFTVVSNNTVRSAYNHGINIEVSEYTVCSGNTVFNTGLITTPQLSQAPWGSGGSPAPAYLRAAIFLFGASYSSVTGNICNGTSSYALVVGANSDNSTVVGNTSYNTGDGCLLSDGYGTADTTNVTVGNNNWDIFGVTFQGNVSLLNKTTGLTFENVTQTYLPSGGKTLGWYEESTFTPVVVGTTTAGTGTYTDQIGSFTRIGNVVNFSIVLGWSAHTGTGNTRITGLPYKASNVAQYPVSIFTNEFAPIAGQVIQGYVKQNTSQIEFACYDLTSGAATALPIDSNVPGFIIAGQYQV